jgi:hypothetical protein
MSACGRYDNLTWLTYAQGRLDSNVAAEMQSHSESCNECRGRLEFCRTIVLAGFYSASPPESWLEEAAATFKSVHPSQAPTDFIGELVYDSYLHDEEAVRSLIVEDRHLVFDLPAFKLDLVLEYSGRQLKLVMGHLLSKSADSAAGDHDFGLELRASDHLYSATANRFGEFSFSVDAQITGEPLELRCELKGGQCAIVLIPS